jgi:hypothetical protein
MTDGNATFTRTRTDHSADPVRLRYIAAQAEHFAKVLDDLRSHLAAAPPADDPIVTVIVEQAAAAAQDLAITAAVAADMIDP